MVALKKTCIACPSQWEVTLEDGRVVYARYRHGALSVGVGVGIDEAIRNGMSDHALYADYVGDGVDGFMDFEELKDRRRPEAARTPPSPRSPLYGAGAPCQERSRAGSADRREGPAARSSIERHAAIHRFRPSGDPKFGQPRLGRGVNGLRTTARGSTASPVIWAGSPFLRAFRRNFTLFGLSLIATDICAPPGIASSV